MDNLRLDEALKVFSPKILGYLIRLVGSFDDAEDLHQEVMLIPDKLQLLKRLSSVLQTIYLMFNEGYSATSGEQMMREPLCRKAIHLGEMMGRLFPDDAELEGMLALMLLQDSHRNARLSGSGELVLLYEALLTYNGSSVARLNYAFALAMDSQLEAAMEQLGLLGDELERYHPFHIARAEIRVMRGQSKAAVADLERALQLTKNHQERAI